MAKISGNEIRPGTIIEHEGGLWASVKVSHVKPGKGGAFAQVELKNLRDGRKLNERFRSEDKVEEVRLENKDQQFLYETDGRLVFMDAETFEQAEVDAELLGDRRPFLQDGMTATVQQDGDAMGKANIRIAVNGALGLDWLDGTDYEYTTEDAFHCIRIPYAKITEVE